jgi:hypothetical protein
VLDVELDRTTPFREEVILPPLRWVSDMSGREGSGQHPNSKTPASLTLSSGGLLLFFSLRETVRLSEFSSGPA